MPRCCVVRCGQEWVHMQVVDEWKKEEKVKLEAGKKPFYLKESEKKKRVLEKKFTQLEESGQLEKYMLKKRKRQVCASSAYPVLYMTTSMRSSLLEPLCVDDTHTCAHSRCVVSSGLAWLLQPHRRPVLFYFCICRRQRCTRSFLSDARARTRPLESSIRGLLVHLFQFGECWRRIRIRRRLHIDYIVEWSTTSYDVCVCVCAFGGLLWFLITYACPRSRLFVTDLSTDTIPFFIQAFTVHREEYANDN